MLGDRIRQAREAAGLTQKQIAQSFGIARESVTNWELGAAKPEIDRIAPLCDLLACDLRWLLTGEGLPPVERRTIAGDLQIWLQEGYEASKFNQAGLARELSARVGRTIDKAAMNKMLSGKRAVSGDELIALMLILRKPLWWGVLQ